MFSFLISFLARFKKKKITNVFQWSRYVTSTLSICGSSLFALTFKHLEGGEILRQLSARASFEALRSRASVLSFRGSIGTTKLLYQCEGLEKQHAAYSGFRPSLFTPVARRKTSHQSADQLATVRSVSPSSSPQLGCRTLFLSRTPSTYQ